MKNQLTYFYPILMLIILITSCNTEKVDIEKERQNAVEEYLSNLKTERQQKLDVIKKFYRVFENGDMSVLSEILAPNYTQYPSDPGQTPDIKGFIKHAKDFASMFSNLEQSSSHILVDGDLVFVRSDIEMKNSGPVFGIPATNKIIKINAFDLHHFNKEGKIDKTWHLEDFAGVMAQIKSK
ncbi:ester cyclase [Thalassobellus sediminis]|uniref:ester cyclase n=1 Tax=Thalassobellus sediminis TaxID=3367753 RepID=UPI0037B2C2BC